MKFNSRKSFSLAHLILVCAIIGLVAALALPAAAQDQQGLSKRMRSFTNSAGSTGVIAIAASTATNVQAKLTLASGKNHMFQTVFAGSGAGTDVVQYWFYPVPDGTNTLTAGAAPLVLSVAANGTTAVIAGTNLIASSWSGNVAVNLTTISNASGTRTIYVTNSYLINDNN